MKDIKFEFMRGKGPGGQHKNKTDSACRVTHIPTGTTAYADERSQVDSKRIALRTLQQRLEDMKAEKLRAEKKKRRDMAIKNRGNVRTYDFKRGVVKDHRTGKEASVKDVLRKGRLHLLRGQE